MRTDAEKKEWHQKMKNLVKQVAALTHEQRAEIARRCMITTCEGHVLSSFNNIFLAYQGGVNLTVVAGFNQWKKAGRKVKAGEHAAGYIYVPMVGKKDPNKQEGEISSADLDVRFRLVPVFDVAQTEEVNQPVLSNEAAGQLA